MFIFPFSQGDAEFNIDHIINLILNASYALDFALTAKLVKMYRSAAIAAYVKSSYREANESVYGKPSSANNTFAYPPSASNNIAPPSIPPVPPFSNIFALS